MSEPHLRLSRCCAEVIRAWHERLGVRHRPANMGDDQFAKYRERVSYFQKLDFARTDARQEIAHEQRSGVLEWYYRSTIPSELWQDFSRTFEVPTGESPRTLGEAARWILEKPHPKEPRDQGKDHDRTRVRAETREELIGRAYEYYADIAAEAGGGLGGVNVLLSTSLERYQWREHRAGEVTLLRPEALGLRIITKGERPDDFVEAVRQGDLVVKSTIGGPREF